jgi:GNAT superfamily N-acetyltransferase
LLRPLEAAHVDDLVARVRQFYAERPGAPWVLWSAWPSPDLQPWGFQLIGSPALMVRLPGTPLPPTPPELRIVEVTGAATMADFEQVFIEGYPVPELQSLGSGALYDARVVGGDLRLWIGYVGDRPLITAAALHDEYVNGIYMVATLPGVRGRGYGTALTAHAVAFAPALPAVLEATEDGYPIYARLGFSEVARYALWLKPR